MIDHHGIVVGKHLDGDLETGVIVVALNTFGGAKSLTEKIMLSGGNNAQYRLKIILPVHIPVVPAPHEHLMPKCGPITEEDSVDVRNSWVCARATCVVKGSEVVTSFSHSFP